MVERRRAAYRTVGAGALAAALFVAAAAPLSAGVVQDKLAEVRRAADFERSYAALVEAVVPAVVFVEVERERPVAMTLPEMPPEFRRFWRRFFGPDAPFPFERGPREPRREEGVGSGFIVSEAGHVVTNAHVVRGASRIRVTLQDGTTLDAELVGMDEKTDLAVLKLDGEGPFPYVEFGDSDKVKVGDKVIAIGNPFGLGGTVTAGIVSATKRELGVGPYDDFLQIDAPINRGNSGGPTFNLDGEVIGVNTLIFAPAGGNVGIGFAIASNLAKEVVAALIEEGRVERGWLGVLIQTVDEDTAAALGLEEARGALVSSVQPDSPAEEAGIRPGDVVVAFNDTAVEDPRDLARLVAQAGPGQRAEVTVVRDGRRRTIPVRLGEMPEEEQQAALPPEEMTTPRLGLTVAPLGREARERLGLPEEVRGGVVITGVEPESPAAEKGLREGDVIVSADGQEVDDIGDLRRAVRKAREAGKPAVLLRIFRDGRPLFVAVRLQATG